MKISEALVQRGFVNQTTAPDLAAILDAEPITVYHGIDPTADSAHAGNFVNWMLLRHLADAGHRVVFLVGGGTGMIGDPKPDVERSLSAPEEVAVRVAKLRTQAERIIGGDQVTFVNNYDWLSRVDLISFLRDIGKHFTVNELVKKDAIATRLEQQVGLSYTEFAYPLLQAYDYLTLYRTYGCTLQVGGSDQWGNIVAGVDLIRRVEQATAHALTVPLVIDKATGKKFGKSEGNAVWLDAEKTTPYQFYQFWLNASDESVIDYLKLFTLLPLSEIEVLEREQAANPGARAAQRTLAHAVTAFVHGEALADTAAAVSAVLFGEASLASLDSAARALLLGNAPVTEISASAGIVDVLVISGLATSKREARTFIESGAITIDGHKVIDSEAVITPTAGSLQLLRRGKKQLTILSYV